MKVLIFSVLLAVSSLSWSERIKLTAVGDPWPVLLNPDTKQQGLLAEIAKEAFQTQGYDLEIKFFPWSRAMVMIQQKQADLLIGAWYTEDRNDYLLYSEAIFESTIKFIKPRTSYFEYTGLASLQGMRVGTILGYQYGEEFLNEISIKRITSSSLLNNMMNIIAGRIDLTLDDQYVIEYMLEEHIENWEEKLSIVDTPFMAKKLYLAANRTNPKYRTLIKAFNLGLEQLKKDGRYANIVKSYDLED
ncbi:MAG: polar amino acid transport system substrate-binding protein [Lysobacterales bacterium]|jgi:polar amino acid transport system substrate-binding protein